MTSALVALAVSGGCLPVPVSGMPRSLGEVEVQWTAEGRDYWVCTASGFGYEVHIRWSAMRCEHLKAGVRKTVGDGETDGYRERLPGSGRMEEDAWRSQYELVLSEGAEESPVLQLESLPVEMKQAADAAHRIALEIEAHEGAARGVLPEMSLAYIADLARRRFAILPAQAADFGLVRSVHYQGGQAIYRYRGTMPAGEELAAHMSATGSVFICGEHGGRGCCVILRGDELTLRLPQPAPSGKLPQPEPLAYGDFCKVACAMLRLAESEAMLEAGTEQELVARTLSALDSHRNFTRIEPAPTESALDPWGILGSG